MYDFLCYVRMMGITYNIGGSILSHFKFFSNLPNNNNQTMSKKDLIIMFFRLLLYIKAVTCNKF